MVLRKMQLGQHRKQQHQQRLSQPCRQQRSPLQLILEVTLQALALLQAPLARLLQIMVQVQRPVADQAQHQQHHRLQLHQVPQHLLQLLMVLRRLLPEHLRKQQHQQRLSQPCRQQRSLVPGFLVMEQWQQALELDLLLGQMQIVWVHQALLVLRVPIRSVMLN
jgi:hypothetical protein